MEIIIIASIITLLYCGLMIWFLIGINQLKPVNDIFEKEKVRFSICIPFRDEAENLPALLKSIRKLNYPSSHYEVLLINDCSTDHSVQIVEDFIKKNTSLSIKLLQNKEKATSPKKEALLKAIQHATHNYLITTDADCELPKNWLQYFNTCIVKGEAEFIAGPVIYKASSTFLNRFQSLDFLSLQAATLGGFGNKHPFLCNGANLCFQKKAFLNVNAYQENKQIASGDDIFLLEKMVKAKANIQYLANYNASVTTVPPKSWRILLQQRIRWASKTSAYQNKYSKLTAILVFLMNLLVILTLVIALMQITSWQLFLVLFAIKLNLDFFVLHQTTKFYQQEELMKSYISIAFIHPLFILSCSVLSFFKSYEWKGRTFKQ